ncbi:MAG: hypothetical protein RIR62_1523 [Pseudomonadota bacterium]|jgi:uncharacterized phiE125 gp8 family phage protein
MLVEQGAVPLAALPVEAFRAHLRMGTGFAEDGVQDGLLESHLRAAMAAIEGRIGKVLLARRFLWELAGWRGAGAQALPVAPVLTVVEVALVDAAGQRTVLPAALWRLRRDAHRPCLEPVGLSLPPVPLGGRAEVVLDAGFSASWGGVPPDLAQAVLLLAAEFYETRHDGGDVTGGLPAMVQALVARWRTVRVLGGGQA